MNRRIAAGGALAVACSAAASSTAVGGGRCLLPAAGELARLPQRGVLRADLDGDGRPDPSGLAVVPRAAAGCRYVVWAQLRSGTAASFVHQNQVPGDAGHPNLAEAARIDRGRGAQLVVDFGVGAGVSAYGVYRAAGARFERVHVGGTAGPTLDTFPWGATLAGGQSTICARGRGSGAVLSAGYRVTPLERVPEVGRLFVERGGAYRLVTWTHRLTAQERRAWTAPAPRGATIFHNCIVAVAR